LENKNGQSAMHQWRPGRTLAGREDVGSGVVPPSWKMRRCGCHRLSGSTIVVCRCIPLPGAAFWGLGSWSTPRCSVRGSPAWGRKKPAGRRGADVTLMPSPAVVWSTHV